MSSIIESLQDVAAKRAELTKQLQGVVQAGLKDFMKNHPQIKWIGWTQFTPYFNDGEECVFRVGEICISLSDNPPDSFYDDEEEENAWIQISEWNFFRSSYISDSVKNLPLELRKELVELERALHNAQDDLKAAFGDHVRVTINQEEILIDSYEHE